MFPTYMICQLIMVEGDSSEHSMINPMKYILHERNVIYINHRSGMVTDQVGSRHHHP
jgi:hypothetical protein